MESVKCNLCGSAEFEVLYKSNLAPESVDSCHYACTNFAFRSHGQIVRCKSCGLIYMNPRPEENANLTKYESIVDQTYIDEKSGRIATFTSAIKEIEKFKQRGRILDVGCYAGFFLEVANKRGWETCGVEPSSWASEYANKSLRLDVRKGTLREADFAPKQFDVVTMWDVLEHLHDPLGTLYKASWVLKDDGLLCLTTINTSSIFARLLGKSWPELMQMHTYYYSRNTLKKMLRKANFNLIKVSNHTRIVRLQYLISRLQEYSPALTGLLSACIDKVGVGGMLVKVNLGDLIMIYARKKQCP